MTIRNAGSFLSLVLAASVLVGCGSNIAKLSMKLEDPDPNVRWDAAVALGKSDSARAVKPLIKALADKNIEVRNAAAEALGKLGKPAVDPLGRLLNDVEPGMRRLAAFALGQSTCPAAAKPLVNALKNDLSPDVRIEAATSLGTLGGATAKSALAAAAEKEKDPAVKAAIVNALGAFKKGTARK